MIINLLVLDDLSARARTSERLRMPLDPRNSPEDGSQRMVDGIGKEPKGMLGEEEIIGR